MTTKKWQYDNSMSRRDNMWTALHTGASLFARTWGSSFRKYKTVGWEYDDIFDELLVRGYHKMEEYLADGWEGRHPGLNWVNCAYSAVWTCWANLRTQLLAKGRHELITDSLDACIPGTTVTIGEGIGTENTLNYKRWHEKDVKSALTEDTEGIQKYIEACMENGLPVDRELVIGWLKGLSRLPEKGEIPGFDEEVALMRKAKQRERDTVNRPWTKIFDELRLGTR